MASQPLYQPYTPPAQMASKPNIRVAFSNGAAVVAVARATADLPSNIREATLDELALSEQAKSVIAQAKAALSSAMYSSFLDWGEAASMLSTAYATDEEGSARLDRLSRALDSVRDTISLGHSDTVFRAYLLALEASDSSCFGPLRQKGGDDAGFVEALARSTYRDVTVGDPVATGLHELAGAAWRLSGRSDAFSPTIGRIVTDAFTRAIIEFSEAADAPSVPPMDLHAQSLRTLLAERNAIITRLNEGPDCSDEEGSEQIGKVHTIEAEIFGRGAQTADDAVVKMIAALQVSAEGFELDDEEAARAIVEARQHFGIGYVHRHLLPKPPSPAVVTTSATGAASAADLRADWHSSLFTYLEARAAADACASDAPEKDRLVEAYLDAMDHLIFNVPAPDVSAIGLKFAWAAECQDGFATLRDHWSAVQADVDRLLCSPAAAPSSTMSVEPRSFQFAPRPDAQPGWRKAWEQYDEVLAADRQVDATYQAARASGVVPDALNDEWDASASRLAEAERTLFATVADDSTSIAWKIGMMRDRDFALNDEVASWLLADLAAIGAGAAMEQRA